MLNAIDAPRAHLKYAYEVDPNAGSAAAFVLKFVGKGERVLEIGAGAGSITRPLKDIAGAQVTALEIDNASADYLETFCERVVRADLNDPHWIRNFSIGEAFDTVVIADVLEHLLDPLATLRAATTLLAPQGAVVISLPHIGHSSVMACLLLGDFEYRDWGLLDRTHLRFFGIKNIKELIRRADLQIIDSRFVIKKPAKTEFREKWNRLPYALKYYLGRSKYGDVYQVVLKAVRAGHHVKEVDLEAAPIPRPRMRWPFRPKRIKKIARRLFALRR